MDSDLDSLRWLDSFPRAKLVVVMARACAVATARLAVTIAIRMSSVEVLMPVVLNVFALWTADSFLQARKMSM